MTLAIVMSIASSFVRSCALFQVKKDEFQDIIKKSETAANVFWMLSNSKKCPHCKSPIEKNEGCNHMRCSKVGFIINK